MERRESYGRAVKNQPEEPTGLPLRAAAMVLIAAAIVFAGLGWLSLGKSTPDSQADTATAAATSSLTSSAPVPTTASAPVGAVSSATRSGSTGASTTASSSSSGAAADSTATAVPVRVFNNSNVSGLASRTASKLRSDGWTIASVQNYTAGSVPTTTVYYGTGAGEQQAAQRIAQELGVTAEPRFAGIKDATPGVIVILTGDPTG